MFGARTCSRRKSPLSSQGSIQLSQNFVYPIYRLVLSRVGIACAIGLYMLVAKTRLGMVVRAGSVDRDMVRALGINVGPIFSMVFGIGAALAP